MLAQVPATVQVQVTHDGAPLSGVIVVVGGTPRTTGPDWIISASVPAGVIEITAAKEGFASASASVTVAAGQNQLVAIALQLAPSVEEEVTVSATRTNQRVDDQPTRVEVLGREEIEEKLLMTPGDIVMMLNEMGGMRVQATSPSLGAASVRIQGMRGRYTRVFSDGLPLFGEVGGLGLLQIPPMDLGQVEVIKGVASSLYGAGAMGGIVNLISRRPGPETERELMLNQTARGGTDVIAWYATPARTGWSMTCSAVGTFSTGPTSTMTHGRTYPGISRAVVRPRVFWDGGNGRSFFATAGFTAENRDGGGQPLGLDYREALTTRRGDIGVVGQMLVKQRIVVTARGALVQQRHRHEFGEVLERDRHDTLFGEVAARAAVGSAHVGRWRGAGARCISTGRRPALRVHLHGSRRLRSRRRGTRLVAVGERERPTRPSQHVRNVCQSSSLDAASRSGHGRAVRRLGRASLARRRSRKRLKLPDCRDSSFPYPGGGTWPKYFSGHRANPRPVVLQRHRIPLPHPRSHRCGSLDWTRADEPPRASRPIRAWNFWARSAPRRSRSRPRTRSSGRDNSMMGGCKRSLDAAPFSGPGRNVGTRRRRSCRTRGLLHRARNVSKRIPTATAVSPYVIVGLLAERQLGRFRLFINGENLTSVRQTRWNPLIRPESRARWPMDR